MRLPRAGDLDLSAGNVAVSGLLALLLLALLGFPLTVLNNTIDEHRQDLADWLVAVRRPFARLRVLLKLGEANLPLRFTVLAVLSSLIYSHMDPAFTLSDGGVQFLGILAGFLGANVLIDVAMAVYTFARFRVTSKVVLFPGLTLLATACVAVTRFAGLNPGVLLGSVGGSSLSRPLTDAEAGRRVAVRQLVVVVVAAYAYVCLQPVQEAATATGSVETRVLASALATVALAGVSSMFFTLVPLTYLDGAVLRRWNPRLWLAMWAGSAVVFVTLLINPNEADRAWIGQEGRLAVLLAAYCLVAFGAYTAFRRYARRQEPDAAPEARPLDQLG